MDGRINSVRAEFHEAELTKALTRSATPRCVSHSGILQPHADQELRSLGSPTTVGPPAAERQTIAGHLGAHSSRARPNFPYLCPSGCLITFRRSISFSGDPDDLQSVQVTLEVPQLAFRASDDIVTRL
jgi:hypothetical protein